jgi:hypothetical protein
MSTLRNLATARVDPNKLKLHNYNVVANNGMKFININERHLTRNQIMKSGLLNKLNNVLNNNTHFSNPRFIRALEVFRILHNRVYINNNNAAPASYIVSQVAEPYLRYFNKHVSNIYKNELAKVKLINPRLRKSVLTKLNARIKNHRTKILQMLRNR